MRTPKDRLPKPDIIELDRFKKTIRTRPDAYDVDTEIDYNRDLRVFHLHRYEPTGLIVIDSFNFTNRSSCLYAIEHVWSLAPELKPSRWDKENE